MLKELLAAPTEELGKWGRFVVFQLRVWPRCLKLLKQNRSGTQAAALAYHTIFGLVPLAIVMMMVFQLFPAYRDVGQNVKGFIYEQAHLSNIEYPSSPDDPDQKIKLTEQIDKMTETFISNLNAGAITVVSGVIVVWAALGLLTTIERAFNNIWNIRSGRNFLQRIINYWALLTLGPLLLGLGLYISTRLLVGNAIENQLLHFIHPLGPYLISVVAFFFLYYVMPNTKVNGKAALWGAAMAALIWTLAKFGFKVYIIRFIPQKAIYGVMGVIPLSVLWIYISWLIVLFGLQLTYATQYLRSLDAEEMAELRKREDCFMVNDFTAMKILGFIMDAFEERRAPVRSELVCNKLNIPPEFGNRMLDHLVKEGMLCRTSEPRNGFIPATDGENITLADISDVVAKASYAQDEEGTPRELKSIMDKQYQMLKQHTLLQVIGRRKTQQDISDRPSHDQSES